MITRPSRVCARSQRAVATENRAFMRGQQSLYWLSPVLRRYHGTGLLDASVFSSALEKNPEAPFRFIKPVFDEACARIVAVRRGRLMG